jgi:hypothetical protein
MNYSPLFFESRSADFDQRSQLSYGFSGKLQPSKKSNPCPVCSEFSGKCRTSSSSPIILCGNIHAGEANGYRFVKPASNPLWSIFAPIDGQSSSNADYLDRAPAPRIQIQPTRKPIDDRDRAYRAMPANLSQQRRENLRRRGLTDAEIDFVIAQHWLWDFGKGFAIAASSLDGKIQGVQIAKDDRNPKYIWDSKDGSGQLPNGEMPLFLFVHPKCDRDRYDPLCKSDRALVGSSKY